MFANDREGERLTYQEREKTEKKRRDEVRETDREQ